MEGRADDAGERREQGAGWESGGEWAEMQDREGRSG